MTARSKLFSLLASAAMLFGAGGLFGQDTTTVRTITLDPNAAIHEVGYVIVSHAGAMEPSNSSIIVLEGVVGSSVSIEIGMIDNGDGVTVTETTYSGATPLPNPVVSPGVTDGGFGFRLIWTNPMNPGISSELLAGASLEFSDVGVTSTFSIASFNIPYAGDFTFIVEGGRMAAPYAFTIRVVDLLDDPFATLSTVNVRTPVDGTTVIVTQPVEFTVNVVPETLRPYVTVDYYVNDVRINVDPLTATINDSLYTFTWTEPYIGDWEVQAVAQLNNGTYRISPEVHIEGVGIGSPPEVTIEAGLGDAWVVGSDVRFNVQARDSSALIETIELVVNGVSVQTIEYESDPGNSPWHFTYRFPSKGPYTIWAMATFSNGNRAISNILRPEINLGSKPSITLLSPLDGSHFIPGTELPIFATAHDPNSLINNLHYFVNDTLIATGERGSDGKFNISGTGSVRGGGVDSMLYKYAFPFAGTYRIYAQAMDETGLITRSNIVTVNISAQDLTYPKVILNHPLPVGSGDTLNDVSVGSSMWMNALATDGDGTVRVVNFYINGQLVGSSASQFRNTFSLYYEPDSPGTYIMYAEGVDNHGKRSLSAPVLLMVEPLQAQLPRIEILPIDDDVATLDVGSVVTVKARVDGGQVDVSQVNFYVNGVFVNSDDTGEDVGLGRKVFSTEVVLDQPGVMRLSARAIEIEPLTMPTDNWMVSREVAVQVKAASNNRGFAAQTFRDFTGEEANETDLDALVRSLDSGQVTRAQLVYDYVRAATYEPYVQAVLARSLLTASYPSRTVMRQDGQTIATGSLASVVARLMPLFQTAYWGGQRLPDGFSKDADYRNFFNALFKNKFAVDATKAQTDRGALQVKLYGAQAFAEEFILDNEALPFNNEKLSLRLSLPNPPNTRHIDSAYVAVAMINLLRVTPTQAEIDAILSKPLLEQIDAILADPRFAAR
jgi:hypothetical protein